MDIVNPNADPIQNFPGEVLSVDLQKKFQTISGFGGAFTDTTAWLFDQLSPDKQEEVSVV